MTQALPDCHQQHAFPCRIPGYCLIFLYYLSLLNRPSATWIFPRKVAYLGMTAIANVIMLSVDDKLDRHTLRLILDSGHSRIPVYQDVR